MIDNDYIQELRELAHRKHYVQITSETLNEILDEVVRSRERDAEREGYRIGQQYRRQLHKQPQPTASRRRIDRDTVLAFLAEGYTAREVAQVADCSVTHVYNIKNGVV